MSIPRNEGVEDHQEECTFSRLLLLQQQQRAMLKFWRWSQEQIDVATDNKKLTLPISRMKNVIRARVNGMLISADLPAFMTKLCELFVQELTLRAWMFAESHHRNILLDIDIAEAIANTESFQFLVDVVRSHQVAGYTMPDTTVAKRNRPNQMISSYQHPQTIHVSPLVGCLPYVAISPRDLLGAQHTQSPIMLMMQEQILLRGKRAKSTLNGPSVFINKMCNIVDPLRNKNNINANTFVGNNSSAPWVSPHLVGTKGDLGNINYACYLRKINNVRRTSSLIPVIDSSAAGSDVATVTQKGRTTHPFSFKDTCASLEDNYVVPNPAGHGDNIGTGDGTDVNQLRNKQQNFGAQCGFVDDGNLSKGSLHCRYLEATVKDDAVLFCGKDLPLNCNIQEENKDENDLFDDILSNSRNNTNNEPTKEQTE